MHPFRIRPAFTLIELLVVVAIIALLLAILLPSLERAREQARMAKCGVQLRSLGMGLQSYSAEENGWMPGVNTSGVTLQLVLAQNQGAALTNPRMPVQTFDWITPALSQETDLGRNRAERFQAVINSYQCPTNGALTVDALYPPGLGGVPDAADFRQLLEGWSPLSYLMPIHFQYWGQSDRGFVIASATSGGGRPTNIEAQVAPSNWEAYAIRYRSKLDNVGRAAEKIAAADGTRYLDVTDILDHDVRPVPTSGGQQFFGSFCSSGAWWGGSTEYGVRSGSRNWDGDTVNTGSNPPAQGRNLILSYRHLAPSSSLPTTAQDNQGSINAAFFDGHVTRMNDRASREVRYWYPSGSIVNEPAEGMTRVPDNFEIP